MRSKENKRWATFIIVLTSVLLYVFGMVTLELNGNYVPAYLSIIFACVPAFGIHAIWKKKTEKE